MATSKELLEDSDYVKTQVMNSDMSEDFKKRYYNLLNISTMATNGISPEEKIQRMTESIAMIAQTQAMYMIEIQQKIKEQISTANKEQCKDCMAMKHAKEIEKEKQEEERFEEYLNSIGLDTKVIAKAKNAKNGLSLQEEDKSWNDILKGILSKPYIYVVFCLMAISPYSVDIIKTIMSAFSN